MRRVLVLSLFLLAGCDIGEARSRGESVTVKLPPPKAAQPQPGFSDAPASPLR